MLSEHHDKIICYELSSESKSKGSWSQLIHIIANFPYALLLKSWYRWAPLILTIDQSFLSTCMIRKYRFSSRDRKFQRVNLVPRISHLLDPWSKRGVGRWETLVKGFPEGGQTQGIRSTGSTVLSLELGIIWDHILLLHCHEHQNVTNRSELTAVDRNFCTGSSGMDSVG